MKKYTIAFALVLALVTAYAVAQQPGSQGNSPAQPGSQAQPGAGQQGYPQQQQPEAAPSQGYPQETPDKDRDQDRKAKKDKDKDRDKNAQAASKSDETLEREVREQLSSNQEYQNVKVDVKDRVVDLTGSVPKKEDRKEAVELARAVQGVKRVKEHLSVVAGGAAAGAGTSASMEGKPSEEARESASEEARERQQNNAGSISGNTSAAAGTQAGVAQPGTSTQSSGQASNDVSSRIQNVQQAIHNDAALAASNVNVSVVNNQIVLSGAVPSAQEKQRAEELAIAQAGGLQVINNINIASSAGATAGAAGGVAGAATGTQQQPPSQSGATGAAVGSQTQGTTSSGAQGTTSESGGMAPDQLKTQLQNAFQSEPTLSSCNITTNVTNDSIELTGTCPTGKEKQTARRMAQSLAGNRRVVDRITVSGRGQGENQEKTQTPPPSF